MRDYRVTVKVRNNRILTAIEAAGGSPGQKWCVANGLPYLQVNDPVRDKPLPSGRGGGQEQIVPDHLRPVASTDKTGVSNAN